MEIIILLVWMYVDQKYANFAIFLKFIHDLNVLDNRKIYILDDKVYTIDYKHITITGILRIYYM